MGSTERLRSPNAQGGRPLATITTFMHRVPSAQHPQEGTTRSLPWPPSDPAKLQFSSELCPLCEAGKYSSNISADPPPPNHALPPSWPCPPLRPEVKVLILIIAKE